MLAHSSLAQHLRMKFILHEVDNMSYNDIDNLKPWEIEAHMLMLEKHLEEKQRQQAIQAGK